MAAAVPLLRSVLRRFPGLSRDAQTIRTAVYARLLTMFCNSRSDSDAADAQNADKARRKSDLAEFASSSDFDILFDIQGASGIMQLY